MALSENLESIDLIDLIATAILMYNRLTLVANDTIDQQWTVGEYSEKARRYTVDYNWYKLQKYYNQTRYRDPTVLPKTIKELLLKFSWLSFNQLPENDGIEIKSKQYLNWYTFRFWLNNVWLHEFPSWWLSTII